MGHTPNIYYITYTGDGRNRVKIVMCIDGDNWQRHEGRWGSFIPVGRAPLPRWRPLPDITPTHVIVSGRLYLCVRLRVCKCHRKGFDRRFGTKWREWTFDGGIDVRCTPHVRTLIHTIFEYKYTHTRIHEYII